MVQFHERRLMDRAVLSAVLVAALLAVAPVAAAEEGGVGTSILDSGDAEEGWLSQQVDRVATLVDGIRGLAEGYYARLTSETPDRTASEAATATSDVVRNNSDVLADYINARASASEDQNVLRVVFERNGETAERFVVADVVNGSYQNLTAVATTERTVDETCTLSGAAAASAPDELASFVEEFVTNDSDLTARYIGEMEGRYSGIDCTFL